MTDKQDLLFELGTEELPPLSLQKLSAPLADEFGRGLRDASLPFDELRAFASPRRLAVIATNCALRQPERDVQRRGPATRLAFDADGEPTRAAIGFAQSCGVAVEQLQREKTDKGEWLCFNVQQSGQTAAQLLPGIAEQAVSRLPISKRMRWGDMEAQFARPVHWLLYLHGDDVVPCELLNVKADRISYGHRFHHPQAIAIGRADEYVDKLYDAKVIASFSARREKICRQVQQQAALLQGQADADDDLLDEVTALVEWPVPITACFEEQYLAAPHEALIYTMKKHQKYFPVLDMNGDLTHHFITIANIESSQPEVVRRGNERVVRPRLADAMFFWQRDSEKSLAAHLEGTKKVVFQQQLGSMYDKSERVASLASEIARYIDGDSKLAHRAGLLSRCDLMTEMVGEFAEMQGIMGRYQAQRDGEPEELALAMDEIYMPRYSGDRLPQTKTGMAVALADKLDTLVGIFGIDMPPTGDSDPFALRRAALGALRILKEHALPIDLHDLLKRASDQLGGRITRRDTVEQVYDFMLGRLKSIYRDEHIAAQTFAAVAQRRPGNVADFDRRLCAVVSFQKLPEAEALAAANKRISNIIKKAKNFTPGEPQPELLQQTAEIALHDAVNEMSARVTPLLLAADYENALRALAALREPVDVFFDEVMVMADDEAIQFNRLSLLARLQRLFLQVADISYL